MSLPSIVLLTLLFLLVLELGLRLFARVPPRQGMVTPRLQFSGQGGDAFRFAPHFDGRLTSPDFDCDLKANEAGFRDPAPRKPRDKARERILVVGGCITFGWGVAEPERITDQIAGHLRAAGCDVSLRNYSFFGWRTNNYAACLAEFIDELRPDKVIIDVFTEYEFSDPTRDLRPNTHSRVRSFLRRLLR